MIDMHKHFCRYGTMILSKKGKPQRRMSSKHAYQLELHISKTDTRDVQKKSSITVE